MDKNIELQSMYNEYIEVFKDKMVVTGAGDIKSNLLLIGEAPGKDEVLKKMPFVGAAGKNLNLFLESINLKRENIYITNAIKYRLCKTSETSGRLINTPAKRTDIEANRDFLLREIQIISPKIIVTLGNVPLKSVTGDFRVNIGDVHGSLIDIEFATDQWIDNTMKLFPLYHPASIIYNRSLQEVYYSDLRKLKGVVDEYSLN